MLYEDFLWAGVLTLQRPEGSGRGLKVCALTGTWCASVRGLKMRFHRHRYIPAHLLDSHYRGARRARTLEGCTPTSARPHLDEFFLLCADSSPSRCSYGRRLRGVWRCL